MQNNIIDLLKSHGLKATPQRVTILSVIEKKGHANIDEIYEDAKTTNPSMSLATVYKNITSLVDINLLKEVALSSLKSKYEINKEPHSHLVCKVCGHVEDIDLNSDIVASASKLSKEKKFQFKELGLNIYGICSKCS